jgi:hypothetical protein
LNIAKGESQVVNPHKIIQVKVDGSTTYQKIDGFGLNINSKHWSESLVPTMDMLREDLGASLYRVDIWGNSNWIDPTGELGKEKALRPEHLTEVYSSPVFQKGWAMMRYLNQHGILPYLTASGDVPNWMLGDTYNKEHLKGIPGLPVERFGWRGHPLVDYEAFCDMLVSMVEWARKKEGLRFNLFGPLNETDIAQPEGPGVDPVEFVKVCELLVDKLDQRGLTDIRLVVAEQSGFGPWYFQQLIQSRKLQGRIGIFSLHDYSDIAPEEYQKINDTLRDSDYQSVPLWMTEYGDLEQSGEKEWYVGWASTSRLFDHLQAGFSGSLIWDAYDNYHDHDEHWTIYGVLRTGLRVYTPKKRYYTAKQIFRFVPPGFERITVESSSENVRLLAFANPERTQFTLVGMNLASQDFFLNVRVEGLPAEMLQGKVDYYRTSQTENCVRLGEIPFCGAHYPFTGIDVAIPGACIFTLTTVR